MFLNKKEVVTQRRDNIINRIDSLMDSFGPRIFDTRRRVLKPTLCAALLNTDDLVNAALPKSAPAYVIRLPHDWTLTPQDTAMLVPELVTHCDVDMLTVRSYMSWHDGTRNGNNHERVLWVDASELLSETESMAENTGPYFNCSCERWEHEHRRSRVFSERDDSPYLEVTIAFFNKDEVSYKTVGLGDWFINQCRKSGNELQSQIKQYGTEVFDKAKEKAEKYSNRPMLFMPYELRVNGRPMEVRLATVLNTYNKDVHDRHCAFQ